MHKNKVLRIVLALISVVIILSLAIYGLFFFSQTTTALLLPEHGLVEVNSGSGFIAYTTQVEVDEDDIIRTGPDSSAVLIIYESILITIDPSTQVTLSDLAKDNVKISQDRGSTWNKFTKLNGVASYSVQTPTSIAAVRGTEFGLSGDRLLVAEGSVSLTAGGSSITVSNEQKAVIGQSRLVAEGISKEDIIYLLERLRKQVRQLQDLRSRELAKHPRTIRMLKSRLQDKKDPLPLSDILIMVDEGKIDLAKSRARIPLNARWINNVFDLTSKIQAQKSQIARLEEKIKLNS